MLNNNMAVVLMSGGMDSALCAAMGKIRGYEIAALHLNYGQRTQERELKSFNALVEYFGIKQQLIVDIAYLTQIGGSSLTTKNIEVTDANLNNTEIPTSYVPFRNANILAIAVSWAEVIGANAIFIGAVEDDSSGYPDCRKEFFDAFQNAIELGTKPETKIEIVTPLINFTKKEIVLEGQKFDVPFHLTWSCYKESEIACGVCDSCALRLRGFQETGIEDPLPYLKIPDYRNKIM